jgi:hypothetical protein
VQIKINHGPVFKKHNGTEFFSVSLKNVHNILSSPIKEEIINRNVSKQNPLESKSTIRASIIMITPMALTIPLSKWEKKKAKNQINILLLTLYYERTNLFCYLSKNVSAYLKCYAKCTIRLFFWIHIGSTAHFHE